ncbi:MAG: hypothetical protein KBT57_07260 [bacterium]|nr:hypothetical protein [Candidatus Limimorpha equi]
MQKKHPYLRDKLSIEQRARFQRGTDVGILAHEYFPGGIDMSPASPSQFPKKIQETWNNLSNTEINVMYEAIFQYNDTLIMLDMLVRDGDKWLAVEVKSSMALSDTYYNDAALQYYVLHGCKVPLSDFKLMYINGDYERKGSIDVKQLFKLESVIDFVKERENYVAKNVERLKNVVALPHAPIINIGTQCHNPYTCDFLGHCWKLIPKDSFLYTNAIDDEQLFSLYFSGTNSNQKLLAQLEPDSLETHQIEALQNGTYYIDFKTLFSLSPKPKPRSIAFLNLLLYRPAVPEIDGTKPYQEMILAFALQGENENGGSFLWNCFEDHSKWRESIDILIDKLSHYEQIVCFTPQNLSTVLLRHEIIQNKDIGYRIFNLFDVLQQSHFYHPSIKAGFTLQHVAEALFAEEKPFEHSRIIMKALSNDLISYQQAKEDLIAENVIVAKTYQHFFK